MADIAGPIDQIANLADEMAYNAHDLDDGLRASLFSLHDLEELAIWRDLKEAVGWRDEQDFSPVVRHEVIRELIGWSVGDVLSCTNAALLAAPMREQRLKRVDLPS